MTTEREGEDKDTGSYWKGKARSFSSYYSNPGFHLRRSVSAFLDARTRLMRSLGGWEERSRVLDLGCGSGVHLREIAPACRNVVGIDYSFQMLGMAQAGLRELPRSNWSLALADAGMLPFPDRHFDWIVSMGLLDYVPSPAAVLAECRRVLVPGGILIASFPKSPSAFGLLRTPPGDWLKARLFDLPPIRNVLSRRSLERLFREQRLEIRALESVWTTMWIVKAVRPSD